MLTKKLILGPLITVTKARNKKYNESKREK